MASKDFTVLIVGGGMCGLACAVSLYRAGIDVHLYEAAPKFDEVGAGVGLGPNAVKALQGLGILNDVLSKADPPKLAMRPYTFITGDGSHEHVFDYSLSADELGLSIYRPVFIDALMPAIDPSRTHFNKRATTVGISSSGRRIVHFNDGTSAEADLIIGADGIKSSIRPFVAGEHKYNRLAFQNTTTYRGLVSVNEVKKAGVKTDLTRPLLWIGLDKHAVTYPIRANELLNVAAVISTSKTPSPPINGPWVEPVTEKELLDTFSEWGNDMRIILDHIKEPSKWTMHVVNPPLDHYIRDRVVLVGDAAHAMVPHLSAGVGQGFEDVYVVYRLLTHPRTFKDNLDVVLGIYDHLRPPRVTMVMERSVRMGQVYEGYGPGAYDKEEMKKHLQGMWEPVWFYNIEKEVDLQLIKLFGPKL